MSKFENFIYTNDEALSEKICTEIIDFTNKNIDIIVKDRPLQFSPQEISKENTTHYKLNVKNDFNYYWSYMLVGRNLMDTIKNLCNVGLVEYLREYPALGQSVDQASFYSPDIKYHIVKSGEGYHAWHSEWAFNPPDDRRILAWHISLTSHENEGELEFLYYKERIIPKAGRLIIWPATFPWVHRGNAIRSDKEKHYLTGWFWLQ